LVYRENVLTDNLRVLLDKLYVLLSRRYLSSSMLEPVRRWYDAGYPPEDVEVLALVAALYDFQMRVAILRTNFSLLLKYLSSKGLIIRDLADPEVSARAVEFVTKHNVGFFHRFDRYGLALPVIVSAAYEAKLRDSAERIVKEVRRDSRRFNNDYVGLRVARKLLSKLWGTESVRRVLDSECGAAKALKLILPKPDSASLLKRMNLFLRWVVRDEYPDLGLWSFIRRDELVVPLDSSIARVCGRLVAGRELRPNSAKSLRIVMNLLRRINPADPVRYDFVLSRPAILGWCKKDLLQSDCDVCPLRGHCLAAKQVPHHSVWAPRKKGEGPEHKKGKSLALDAVKDRFTVKELRTGAELRCWRERTIDHGLRPDIYCENDAIVVGEVKVLRRMPRKPSEMEGITQLIRYYKYVVEEGLSGGRPIKAVLAYYVPKEDVRIPQEVCSVLEEMAMLALVHGSNVEGSIVKEDIIVLEVRPEGRVKELCRA